MVLVGWCTVPARDTRPAIRAHHAAVLHLRAQARDAAGRIWGATAGLNDAALVAWLAAIVPVALAARTLAVRLMDTHLSNVVALQSGAPWEPSGLDADELARAVRGGVPLDDVYSRSIVTARWASTQMPFDIAMGQALDRATTTIDTDTLLASRDTTAAYAATDQGAGIDGWERVLGDAPCELCDSLADTVYGSEDLMPIHDHCQCSTAAVIGGDRPASTLNDETLAQRPDVVPVDVTVEQHGELGPVLTAAGDHWQGPPR